MERKSVSLVERSIPRSDRIRASARTTNGRSPRRSADLAKRFPESTIVQFNYLPTIHAAAALQGGSTTKAIEALVPVAPYELGSAGQTFSFALYPVYLRGEAYLAAHQGSAAAAEFQKIVNHPGVVENEPIGALGPGPRIRAIG